MSETYVTNSALSAALATVISGSDIDTDTFVTNAALSTAICYVGNTKPANFHGIFFKSI